MASGVEIKGQKELEAKVKKMRNPRLFFDQDVAKTARNGLAELIATTPRDTGNTAQGWTKTKRLGDSEYLVGNKKKTEEHNGKSYLIAKILNDGRPVIYPKKAKALYIPLTDKGKARDGGAVFGVDFVLAKKAKAYPGTQFITKSQKKSAKELVKLMIKRVRSLHSGRNS